MRARPLDRAAGCARSARAPDVKNAVVKDGNDRRIIKGEARRIMELGMSQTEACRQVAEQMKQGRAGQHRLSMKYDLASFEATVTVVRRILNADW